MGNEMISNIYMLYSENNVIIIAYRVSGWKLKRLFNIINAKCKRTSQFKITIPQ